MVTRHVTESEPLVVKAVPKWRSKLDLSQSNLKPLGPPVPNPLPKPEGGSNLTMPPAITIVAPSQGPPKDEDEGSSDDAMGEEESKNIYVNIKEDLTNHP